MQPTSKQVEAIVNIAYFLLRAIGSGGKEPLREEVRNNWTRQQASEFISNKKTLEEIRKEIKPA